MIAVVTGAAGGIGRAIALRLIADGATVVGVDRDPAGLATFAAQSERAHAERSDVTDATAMHAVFERTRIAHGPLDALVNGAGVISVRPLLELEAQDWRRTFEVNVIGSFVCLQAAAKQMLAASGGAIVNISSIAAQGPRPDLAHYAASKAAVLSLTRSASVALAPSIRVNALCPGVIRTPMWEQIDAALTEQSGAARGSALAARAATIPLRRAGEPEDIAAVAAFLLSNEARYMTGAAVNVDGGIFG